MTREAHLRHHLLLTGISNEIFEHGGCFLDRDAIAAVRRSGREPALEMLWIFLFLRVLLVADLVPFRTLFHMSVDIAASCEDTSL